MKKPVFLGIDLGTSSLKLVLINLSLEIIFSHSLEYDISSPMDGFAEQDPQIWVNCTQTGLSHVAKFIHQGDYLIKGLGVTGQMHSLVCLDRDRNPVRPAILWSDLRASDIVENLKHSYGKEQWKSWIGNPIAAGFTLPSWLWIRSFEKVNAQRVQYLIQPKDYIRFWLTGELCSEPSDASATGFFHPGSNNWVPEILSLAGITTEFFPPLKKSFEVAGYVKPEIQEQFGFVEKIPVVAGGSDQAIQALAYDVINSEDCLVTIGSGGQIFMPLQSAIPDPGLRLHLFCHVWPETWHYEAATLSAGLSFRWLRSLVNNQVSYQELADLASNVEMDATLFFLPYLNGERTPWMDPHVAGAFLGLKLNHQLPHLARSVMEGVVFSMVQSMSIIQESGLTPRNVIFSGGASKHPFWAQLLADGLDMEIMKSNITEATAKGAAIAAWIGVNNPDISVIHQQIKSSIRFERNYFPQNGSISLREKFNRFKEIYPKIQI